MIKKIKDVNIDINNIRHGKKCNVITFQEDIFNENQFNAVAKQYDKLGFLNCSFKYKNDNVDIYYDTTDLVSINEYFQENTMVTETEFIGILKTICQTIKSCSNYIYFSERNFLVDGDILYIDAKDKSIYMTYVPINKPITDDVICDFKEVIRDWINNKLRIKIGEKNFTQGILEELRDSYLDVDKFIKFLNDSIDNIGTNNNISSNLNIENKPAHSNIVPDPIKISEPINPYKNINESVNNRNNYNYTTNNKKEKKSILKSIFSRKKEKVIEKEKANFNKKNIVSQNVYDDSYDTVLLSEELSTQIGCLIGQDQGNTEHIKITKNEFIIGRLKESVDYDIANRAIGKVHAKFICENEKFYIVDLDSKNGTFLNNHRLQSNMKYELKDGVTIMFANSTYKFKIISSEVAYE